MHVSQREQRALGRIFAILADDLSERDVRLALGGALLDLLRADHFASFVWNPRSKRFDDGVWLNMSAQNLACYDAWYQFHDPITFALQARRHATLVSEVLPHRDLTRTEFFTDFLRRDGLCWGINLHAFDRDCALGDLRIWRGAARSEFEPHEKHLLDLIEPALVASLRRAHAAGSRAPGRDGHDPAGCAVESALLSARELEVAHAVLRGMTDKQIAAELGLSVSTVRTYLNRLFDKTGTNRRAGLAQWLARRG
ncbi:MAG: LuxR C-terminal-related transcriptional regulator [Burkholderiaceae bacterium]